MQMLRPYQLAGVERIHAAWNSGARKALVIAPTGSGKTSLFTTVALAYPRVLILVHRRELATQTLARLREFGASFGCIMSGEPARPNAPIQVASVQTLIRRTLPPADLVVCDEAHLSTAQTWQTILSGYPDARILAVTATPWRLSGKPLAGFYDESIVVATPSELREQGYLCPYVGFGYLAPDLSGVKTTGGDFNEQQAAQAMSVVVDTVVEEWGKHARELSTVVFAVTVEHSTQLRDKFRAAGVSAEHLDGSTSLEMRRGILRRVESGQTRVLCNVGVAVEGLDIPRLKCCILARPTQSLARYIQMVGRVRRPWDGITARIHDHSLNISRHGLPDADRDYTLSAKPEKPPSLSTCEVCLAVFSGSQCPACNHENEPREVIERVVNTVTEAEQFTFTSEELQRAETEFLKPPVPVRWTTVGRSTEGRLLQRYTEQTEYGPRQMYLIQGERRQYALPGTVELNLKLSSVRIDTQVRITYTGVSGKRKLFKVEIDEDRGTSSV